MVVHCDGLVVERIPAEVAPKIYAIALEAGFTAACSVVGDVGTITIYNPDDEDEEEDGPTEIRTYDAWLEFRRLKEF